MKTYFPLCVLLLALLLGASCTAKNELAEVPPERVIDSLPVAIGQSRAELPKGLMVIYQDSESNYWYGGNEAGVYRYDGENLRLFTVADGLVENKVIGIQEDKAGNLYFDTSEGVSKYDGRHFTTLEVVETTDDRNEWQLNQDDLWFRMGWSRNGPYRYDGKSLYALDFPPVKQADDFYAKYPDVTYSPYGIYCLYQDSKGAIWFGTSSLGICRYDGKTLSWLYEEQLTTTPGGGAFGIRSILEDREGAFWFCNSKYRYEIAADPKLVEGTSYLVYERKDGLGYPDENGKEEYPYYMSITEDREGDLWMATYDEGVWRKTDEQLVHYPVEQGGKGVSVFSIYQDRAGTLWLTTHNSGIYRYDGEAFVRFELP